MKLSIVEKGKKDLFISLFHLLKNCTNIINIMFNEAEMYIQGMDKSHVCLFDLKIASHWFAEYHVEKSQNISVDAATFHSVLSMNQEHHQIMIYFEGEPDHLNIDLLNNNNNKNKKSDKDFDKYFKIPLTDLETDLLNIPETEYDAEFSIPAKKMQEIIAQLIFFGDTMNIECSEEKITLGSSGVNGEMNVNIPIDDLSEYAISEGEKVAISYSLNYIHKMCLTTKVSNEISFSASKNFPMKIKYNIGENSHLMFYIAPKIGDGD